MESGWLYQGTVCTYDTRQVHHRYIKRLKLRVRARVETTSCLRSMCSALVLDPVLFCVIGLVPSMHAAEPSAVRLAAVLSLVSASCAPPIKLRQSIWQEEPANRGNHLPYRARGILYEVHYWPARVCGWWLRGWADPPRGRFCRTQNPLASFREIPTEDSTPRTRRVRGCS